MQLLPLTPEQIHLGLCAMKTVAVANRSLGDEERTVLAGMAEYYEPEALVGRKVIMVVNLAPRKMRGIMSQGMLLAAEADGKVSLLQPDQDLPAGAKIR